MIRQPEKNELVVSVVPVDIAFADKEANINAAADGILSAAALTRPDIIVLPELFSTGYINDPQTMAGLAESEDGPTLSRMRALAAEAGCAICGSFVAAAPDGNIYNRAFFIGNDVEARYDKRHLFSISREAEVFQNGTDTPPVVCWRGWKVAMTVCYDLRFPVWMRNRNYAYDLMLLPANWPQARAYALEHLLIARAIENQAPIVCANRGGEDDYGVYDGCSFAFDHMGKPAFAAESLTAVFSMEKIRKARERFPAANDADSFCII